MVQLYVFNFPEYKINKPLRLIELFAGIGAQAKALENLGIPFEHYRICEYDKYAVCSYNAIHGTEFQTSDITKIHAADLGITETDKYDYIMTYSFPCQDLSSAGKMRGMNKGTRSGLLWEVERLLDECSELPQILLMENVPEVIGTKNRHLFVNWFQKLEQLGYQSYYQVLNATDYGIPQNRERCFMISILGEYSYYFPDSIPLKLCLGDMLETEVDNKYYLSEETINKILNSSFAQEKLRMNNIDHNCNTLRSRDYKGAQCTNLKLASKANDSQYESTARIYSSNGIAPTLTAVKGGNQEAKVAYGLYSMQTGEDRYRSPLPNLSRTLKANIHDASVKLEEVYRKLTQREYYRLMGFTDADYDKAREALNKTFYKGKDKSGSQLYKQAGNSIVVNVLMAILKEFT